MEINIKNMSYQQQIEAVPTKATIQVITEAGADTIELHPEWAAMLLKIIRQGGQGSISLNGCLPANSPERQPHFAHVTGLRGAITPSDWQGWLQGKAEIEEPAQ